MKRNEVVLVIILGLITIPVAFLATDWAGIFLIYISVALLFISSELRGDRRALVASLIMLTIRHGISIVNAYYTTVYGTDVDAAGFHLTAQELANTVQPGWLAQFGEFEAGAKVYRQFLAFAYLILGDSLLVGQGLSIITYVLSNIVLVKLSKILGFAKYRTSLIILYGILPPAILFSSATMRESYQMLFLLSAAYWTIKFKRDHSISSLIISLVSTILLGLLHNGLVIYAIFLVGFNFFWGLGLSFRYFSLRQLALMGVSIFVLPGLIFVWFTLAGSMGGASRALVSGEGATYTGAYRERGEEGRANYDVKLDTSSPVGFAVASPLVFIYYMMAPFPWQIRSGLDVYALLEVYLRLALIYFGIVAWRHSTGERRDQYRYVLIVFFSLEFMWSLGTANWGTAIRHHLIAYGLIVVLGGPGLIQKSIFMRYQRAFGLSRRKRILLRPQRKIGPDPIDKRNLPTLDPKLLRRG